MSSDVKLGLGLGLGKRALVPLEDLESGEHDSSRTRRDGREDSLVPTEQITRLVFDDRRLRSSDLPVGDVDGLPNNGFISSQIVEGHDSSGLAGGVNDTLSELARVERLDTFIGDQLERIGQVGPVTSVTLLEGGPVGSVGSGKVGVRDDKPGGVLSNRVREIHVDVEAVSRKFDGRLEKLSPGKTSVTIVEELPSCSSRWGSIEHSDPA